MAEYLDVVMVVALCGGLLLGYPVALTLIGLSVLFAGLGWALGAFDATLLGATGQRLFGILTNTVLIAIPMFVFMGIVLQRSGIAEDLLTEMGRLFGRLRGGLGVSVILVGRAAGGLNRHRRRDGGCHGADRAAGHAAQPLRRQARLRHRLHRRHLGPDHSAVHRADLHGRHPGQRQPAAHRSPMGNFAAEALSASARLFAGALMPGAGVGRRCMSATPWCCGRWLHPDSCPPVSLPEGEKRRRCRTCGSCSWPWCTPVLLIVGGSGLDPVGGVATPTESAAVGAVGAMLLAAFRVSPHGRHAAAGSIPVTRGFLALVLMVVLSTAAPICGCQRGRDPGCGDMPYLIAAVGGCSHRDRCLLAVGVTVYCLLRLLGNGVHAAR